MAAGLPGAEMFPFENPGCIIFDPFTDDHLATNIYQIEHSPDRVTGGRVSLFLFASADPGQRVQGRRFSGPKKVKFDDSFQILKRLLTSAHGGKGNLVSCPRNSRYFVAIKICRRQGARGRTGAKGAYRAHSTRCRLLDSTTAFFFLICLAGRTVVWISYE